ncbi:ATP-binding protein [Streptomyces sp. NBC_01353]|uniref:ATP-binding protein n=1 Tax=Streptomyces sp. NBC_01353 TaxID=2903835 RepID=UPI002E331CA3|nr:ATP-binding protein [Streptomyces sp. NBC_01353]
MGEVITRRSAVRQPPLSASVSFEGADMGDRMIASARDFAADFLTAAPAAGGDPVSQERVDLARLVVSELVTNVVRHAPGPCRVLLEWFEDALDISVADRLAAAPVARPQDPQRIGQHGLEIVVAVCESVSVEPQPSGKRVRARLSLA